MLARLYDAGGELPFNRVWEGLCTRREAFRILDRQYTLGNVKRHRSGEPITLTSSARIAIAAGRACPPVTTTESSTETSALRRSNVRAISIPISASAVKAACTTPRTNFPMPSDDFLRASDNSREAAVRRATRLLAMRIMAVHPERARPGY